MKVSPLQATVRLSDMVGNTPLLRLENLCPEGRLYAKLEWQNPGGSAKDRPALNIIRQAEKQGLLKPGMTLLDATSGNTGIAYAMLGAAFGYEVCLCLPASVTPSRLQILRAYGAQLVLTDPQLFSDGAILKARELFKEQPEKYFYADQYSNPANWQAHYHGTGPELVAQTGGSLTHFVSTLGTSGTFVGTGRYLKEQNPGITLVEVQPDSAFHGLEGMKHMASSIVPAFYDPHLADLKRTVRTERAYDQTLALAQREGLLVGISSGAAAAVGLDLVEAHPKAQVVVVFPDNGMKYLSEKFWGATLRNE